MLDAVLLAYTAEDMADPSQCAALVTLHELHAVVGQDGVDPVDNRLDQHAQEGGRGERGCAARDGGAEQHRGAVDRDRKRTRQKSSHERASRMMAGAEPTKVITLKIKQNNTERRHKQIINKNRTM